METLGKYHAMSLAIQDQEPEEFEKITKLTKVNKIFLFRYFCREKKGPRQTPTGQMLTRQKFKQT